MTTPDREPTFFRKYSWKDVAFGISLLLNVGQLIALLPTIEIHRYDDFRVTYGNYLYAHEKWGNLILEQYIDIKNTGNKSGLVNKIGLSLKIPNLSQIQTTYYALSIKSDGNEVFKPFMLIELDKKEKSNGFIRFETCGKYENDSPLFEKDQIAYTAWKVDTTNIAALDSLHYYDDKIDGLVDKRLASYKPGNYFYTLKFWKDNEKTPFKTIDFSFVLTPDDVELLKQMAETERNGGKNYGNGIQILVKNR